MDFLHKLLLSGEIAGIVASSLIAISFTMATVRAFIAGNKPPEWAVSDVQIAEIKASQEHWPHRMLVAFDIAFNVIFLRGQQDETISTHSWRAQQEGKLWGKLMCKWLDGFEWNHGYKAACGDLERAKSRVGQLSKMLGA